MIKKVFKSESDLYNLSIKRTEVPNVGVNLEYKKIVVNKPWGYEYLLFENNHVAIWILCLKKNCTTSMHCHPNKKTSLVVLSGSAISSTLDTEFSLNSMDGLIIDSGVFHSTRSTSDEETFLMEIETPPNKNDLVRLKDQYGRENKAYEGKNSMSDELSVYSYCDFHSFLDSDKLVEKNDLVGRSMKIMRGTIDDVIEDYIVERRIASVCVLDGKLFNGDNVVLDVGEIMSIDTILKIKDGLKNENDNNFLIIY